MNKNFKDLTGKNFGRLLVLGLSDHRSNVGNILYDCLCDCGKNRTVLGSHLVSGHTQSCGCYKRDWCIENKTTHGMRHTRLYNILHKMIGRCYTKTDTAYRLYGARGISICDEWLNNPSSIGTVPVCST